MSPSPSTSPSSSSIFLGILGVGLSILFCTSFCRACQRYREAQIEREAWRRSVQDGQPPIYFIPFPGNRSHPDTEDPSREPRNSQDYQPPQYSAVSYGPPPAYNDVSENTQVPQKSTHFLEFHSSICVVSSQLGFKPDDLPPAYTEDNPAVLPITPPPQTDLAHPQTQLQQ